MPRPASAEARSRLSLELPERVRERLERVRVATEADSLTEVIRRALIVYDTLLTATAKEGGKLILRTADNEEREIQFW